MDNGAYDVFRAGEPARENNVSLPPMMPGGRPWPRISVVTPSYNQAAFLEQTIRSVLAQGYPNLEYMVLDGGSRDGSVDVIRRYAHRLDYWISEPDGGQSAAIRRGFDRATGEILTWLNSDDYLLPGALEAVARSFVANPTCNLLYGDCDLVNGHGELLERRKLPEFRLALLRAEDFIWQPAAFFRRTAYLAVGGLDPALHWGMDWDLWLKLARNGEVGHIPRPLAVARLYAENKTESGGPRRLAELTRIFVRHRIFNQAFFLHQLHYGAKLLEQETRRWPRVHRLLFVRSKPVLKRVNRHLRRAAGSWVAANPIARAPEAAGDRGEADGRGSAAVVIGPTTDPLTKLDSSPAGGESPVRPGG